MPIYEFRCAQCGNVQEIIVSSSKASQDIEMKCDACEGEVLERLMSSVSYSMGASKSGPQPSVSTKSCGENTCGTLNIPGPTR